MFKLKKTGPLALFIFGIALVLIIFQPSFVPARYAVDSFREITISDPLLVGSDINFESLNESLKSFREIQGRLGEELNIEGDIMPTGFIESLSEVAEKKETFLKDSSKENGLALIIAYRESARKYQDDLTYLKDRISESFPEQKEQDIAYPGSTTSNTLILDDLKLMQENGNAIEEEITEREKILKGKKIYFRKIKKAPDANSLTVNQSSQGDKILADHPVQNGIYILDTACFQPTGDKIPFGYTLEKKLGRSYILPKILTDDYYQKINTTIPAEAALAKKGIIWRSLRDGNAYRCNNLEYQPTLLAMSEYVKRYSGDVMLDNEVYKTTKAKLSKSDRIIWDKGIELERTFVEKSAHNETDFNNLGAVYDYLEHQVEKHNLNLTDEMRSRKELIKYKEANLDLIYNSLFSYDDMIKRIGRTEASDYGQRLRYLYTTRSNYSIAFLNHSDAVWRIKQMPRYVKQYKDQGAYINLLEMRKKYTKKEIELFNSISENDILSLY